MQRLFVLAALVIVAVYANRDAEIIKIVNSDPSSTWVAGTNQFSTWSKEEIQRKLVASAVPRNIPYTATQIKAISAYQQQNKFSALPNEFDSRKQWPKCVHPIRDQAHCGSCWAFAATESFSDRLCIASNGTVDVVLSPQDLVSCDWYNFGCSGGMPYTSWFYMKHSGVVSDVCFPYQSQNGTAPSCISHCQHNSTISFKENKYYLKTYYSVGSILTYWARAEKMAEEIQKGGPIEVAFSVYEDFLSYKGGIYKYTTGSFLGGHAVKAVGWGVDSETNTPYWIIANSWTEKWGENGFFRIVRGKNEVGIEGNAMSGVPDLSRLPKKI